MELWKKAALGLVGVIVLALIVYGFLGLGSARAESQYTGVVVDVVEDKGIVFRPSWVNMKPNARSSDIQEYCIHPQRSEGLTDRLYSASEQGVRVTVTYERPLWVSPAQCEPGQPILTGVTPVNKSVTLNATG